MSEKVVMPDSLIDLLNGVWKRTAVAFNGHDMYVERLLGQFGYKLTGKEVTRLANRVAWATEEAHKVMRRHLTTKATSDRFQVTLPNLLKRQLWDPTGDRIRGVPRRRDQGLRRVHSMGTGGRHQRRGCDAHR